MRSLRLFLIKHNTQNNYLEDVLSFVSKRATDIENWMYKHTDKESETYLKSRRLAIGVSEEIYNDHKDNEKRNVDNIDYIEFLRHIKGSEHSENLLNRINMKLWLYHNIDQPAVKGLFAAIVVKFP